MSSKSKNKAIIAMKGHPFTRKSQFATHIAASLKCQLLSVEDFLDVLNPNSFQALPCKPQDVAFQIICQIAKSHLSSGLFKQVVVDSRLSSRSHLDQLIELASSLSHTRLVIIECKADNVYGWQTIFLDHMEQNLRLGQASDKWHKPKNWDDVEKAIQHGYDERSDGYKVSKLVLDPILDYQDDTNGTPFIDAVQHMITRNENEGPDLVVYQKWRQSRYLLSKVPDRRIPYFREMQGSKRIRFCSSGGGHIIEESESVGDETNCMACKDRIIEDSKAFYTCKHCSFSLHKNCAELLDESNKPPEAPSHAELSNKTECWAEFDMLLALSPCNSCAQGFNPKSYPCDDCFFGSHLEERLLPTVIRSECDEHFLCVIYGYLNPDEEHFKCKACGEPVAMVWYSCKTCGVAYHYSCLTEINVRVAHEHGGHHHNMLLQYSCEEEEDYLCLVCFENEDPERRDPSRWFYSCEECEFVAHLRCVDHGILSLEKYLNKEEEFPALPMGSNKSEIGEINQKEEKEEEEEMEDKLRSCSAGYGHYITEYIEEGLEFIAECRACDKKIVMGAAYTCKHCDFALHKECAELVDDHNKLKSSLTTSFDDEESWYPSLSTVLSDGYQDFVKDGFRCKSSNDNLHSNSCGECLFIAHLKTKLLPTVIRHDCHPHFLSILIKDVNPEAKCACDACGDNLHDAIWYTCKLCGVDYDYDCLVDVDVSVEHQHHRQQHNMSIQYSLSSSDAKDSFCDICLENGDRARRNPRCWFYSCQDCKYEAHLKCIQEYRREEDLSSVDTNYGD